jgi:hypothetical protein
MKRVRINENITPDNLSAYPMKSEAFKKIDVMITNKINKFMHLEKFRNLIFCIFGNNFDI